MKIMLVGDWSRTTFEEIGTKFGKGEDANPPEGITLLARWHDPSSRLVWVVVDAPDSAAVQAWTIKWTDYMDWQTFTVIEDEEVGAILQNELSL